jgi:undecaprenyl-phosphate 4-deoxy-4-formamido-L-arabinose transferase
MLHVREHRKRRSAFERSAASRRKTPVFLSVVIPVFNGAATIGALVDAVVRLNPGHELQVVLVNDGSADGSAGRCRELARRYPGVVTFVDLARNVGEHNAVMAGLAHARGSWCAIMDDDFQNPPEEVFRLVAHAVAEQRDIVFSAYQVKCHHWARNLGSRLTNALAQRLMNLPEGLYLSSFKCLSRFTVDHVLRYRGPFPYLDGLALRVTRNIGVLETRHEPSRKARSGYTAGKLFGLWAAMAVNFSVVPLRAGSILGICFSLAGFAGALAVTVEKLRHPELPVGWASLTVAVLLLSGVQLLISGVLGEYLGQLVLTANGTPQYAVRAVVEDQGGAPGLRRDA